MSAPEVSSTAVDRVEAMVAAGEMRLCRQTKPLTEKDAQVLVDFADELRTRGPVDRRGHRGGVVRTPPGPVCRSRLGATRQAASTTAQCCRLATSWRSRSTTCQRCGGPPADPVARVRELHRPIPAGERCDSETWAPDHYGEAVDAYWIRCTRTGQHDEHSDAGNTGCTWPLTDAERAAQEQLPRVCDECEQPYPCPTIELLGAES